MKRNNPLWGVHNFIWKHNIFWFKDFLWWRYHFILKQVAKWIEKKNLYPVTLNKELLDIWKGKND